LLGLERRSADNLPPISCAAEPTQASSDWATPEQRRLVRRLRNASPATAKLLDALLASVERDGRRETKRER
jgi:hypothetical protein